MNRMKDNIYYKKIRRWFKSRRKKQDASSVIYFRRSLLYLRPMRLWLSKIAVRYSDLPRRGLWHRTQSMRQSSHRAIKKNRHGLLRSQIAKGDPQWSQFVEEPPHLNTYQYHRRIVVPMKQQCPYGRELTRLLSYVFKNTLLTGQLPFRGLLASVVRERNLSNIIISLTVKMNFTDLLVLVVRERNLLNRISSMRSSQQKITVNYPICFVSNKKVEILQNIQMKENKLNNPSGQDNNEMVQENKSKKPWWPGFNWDDTWDPDWDHNEGGMHGRFSPVMTWDSSHWGDSENNNGEHKHKEKEIYTIRNHWNLSITVYEILNFNIEQIPDNDSIKYLKYFFEIYQYLHRDSKNPPKTLEDLAGKNMLDWPWSIEALGNLLEYSSLLKTQNLHVDSRKLLGSDRQLELNQFLHLLSLFPTDNRDFIGVGRINSEIDYGSQKVSESSLSPLGKSTPSVL